MVASVAGLNPNNAHKHNMLDSLAYIACVLIPCRYIRMQVWGANPQALAIKKCVHVAQQFRLIHLSDWWN